MGDLSFADIFSLLPKTENPKQTFVDGVPYILHEDHRWCLPIVLVAQQGGLLPKPCTVAMFDWHHDALNPLQSASDELKRLRIKPTIKGVTSLCAKYVKKNDDDWLKAGMELGFFGDAVIFGVDDTSEREKFRSYRDHLGSTHKIEMCTLPKNALSYEGRLTDAIRRDKFGTMWEILGWEVKGASARFISGLPKILLTIDLDCFAIPWRDYIIPWPDFVFESEFHVRAGHCRSGQFFFRELASKAGLVTIARETRCCGGSENAQSILQSLIHYGFEDKFSF